MLAETPLRAGANLSYAAVEDRGEAQTGTAARYWLWLIGGLFLGVLVPFLFVDVLRPQRDLYYLVYFVAVIGFFWSFARRSHLSWTDLFRVLHQ